MTPAQRETARRRENRLAFERAVQDGVTVAEGHRRNARDRWVMADAELKRARCRQPQREQEAERPLQWWQRD